MSSYSYFADYYDTLTQNVAYPARADYLCMLLRHLQHSPGLLLDLACGTGSLTVELAKRGLDVFGIDGSASMLSIAQQKANAQNLNILFLCQKMQGIDLYGTVDTVICTLDSINHLTVKKDVQSAFKRVSLFLNPGGYFIFDANTPYKHNQVLANNTFVYDTEKVFCVWQNTLNKENSKVRINLDFFEKEGNLYCRRSEEFFERAYSSEELQAMLETAGLQLVHQYEDMSLEPPSSTSERIIYVARKL